MNEIISKWNLTKNLSEEEMLKIIESVDYKKQTIYRTKAKSLGLEKEKFYELFLSSIEDNYKKITVLKDLYSYEEYKKKEVEKLDDIIRKIYEPTKKEIQSDLDYINLVFQTFGVRVSLERLSYLSPFKEFIFESINNVMQELEKISKELSLPLNNFKVLKKYQDIHGGLRDKIADEIFSLYNNYLLEDKFLDVFPIKRDEEGKVSKICTNRYYDYKELYLDINLTENDKIKS